MTEDNPKQQSIKLMRPDRIAQASQALSISLGRALEAYGHPLTLRELAVLHTRVQEFLKEWDHYRNQEIEHLHNMLSEAMALSRPVFIRADADPPKP